MCIFCKITSGEIPSATLYEDEFVKVILDRGPASKGHALVIPKKHVRNIFDIDEDTASYVMNAAIKTAAAMKKTLNLDGLNVLQNNEEIAGQSVFHYHMHLIPRYENDGVKILPQSGDITDEELTQISDCIKAGF